MSSTSTRLVIDARPRGPGGLLAREPVLGRPLLAHLLDATRDVGGARVEVHARLEDHALIRGLIPAEDAPEVTLRTGPPPEGAVILRTDRLYDPRRLGSVVRRGRDPESAVIWRLDRPGALEVAGDELIRRRSYQPLGRFWALAPARAIAAWLRPTRVRPNAVTLASAGSVLAACAVVAFAGTSLPANLSAAAALAIGLVLDTADGHLARLQGTASAFGRWLDSVLDEVGDMALHAAVAFAGFARSGNPAWLMLGMAYGMAKYLFAFGNMTAEGQLGAEPKTPAATAGGGPAALGMLKDVVRLLGHADVRWHLWILLAALGRLDVALAAYTAYFAARALAGGVGKAVRHA